MTSDGLEDVVAADTVLSEVDGRAGRLVIRGRSLDDIAGRIRFEEVVHMLFEGFFDPLPDDLAPALGAARAQVFSEVAELDKRILALTPVEAVRALMPPSAAEVRPARVEATTRAATV